MTFFWPKQRKTALSDTPRTHAEGYARILGRQLFTYAEIGSQRLGLLKLLENQRFRSEEREGFEPPTPKEVFLFSRQVRSARLRHLSVRGAGFEPTALGIQNRYSTKLSYPLKHFFQKKIRLVYSLGLKPTIRADFNPRQFILSLDTLISPHLPNQSYRLFLFLRNYDKSIFKSATLTAEKEKTK